MNKVLCQPPCPNTISLLSQLQKNYLGSLLKIKILGPHPLTFLCRSQVGLKNVFFFLKISNAQHKRYRRLYGRKQFSFSIVHPLPVSAQRQLLSPLSCMLLWTESQHALTYRHATGVVGGVGGMLHGPFCNWLLLLSLVSSRSFSSSSSRALKGSFPASRKSSTGDSGA